MSSGRNIEDISMVENLHNATDADVTIIENLAVVVPADQISEIMNIVADIRSMCQITLYKVNSLEKHSVVRRRILDPSDDIIGNLLPLKTMDSLLHLEDLLKNNEIAAAQLMNKLVLVGGSDYKNLTRRCLQQIIEDELAQYCSWTGQKQNFKISDLKIMDILKSRNCRPEDQQLFSCVRCGKIYKNRSTLSRHIHHECGRSPEYACKDCNKKFRRKDGLKMHQLMVHNEKRESRVVIN